MEICNSVSIEIAATNLSDTRLVSNDNYLIRPDYPRYYYSYACGIKSSGSETDGYNLVSSVDVDGKYVVSVVLGARMTEAENGYYDIQSFVRKRLFKCFLTTKATGQVNLSNRSRGAVAWRGAPTRCRWAKTASRFSAERPRHKKRLHGT
jgi:D-alanyl-D-alanine carboxypeptidase